MKKFADCSRNRVLLIPVKSIYPYYVNGKPCRAQTVESMMLLMYVSAAFIKPAPPILIIC